LLLTIKLLAHGFTIEWLKSSSQESYVHHH